MQYRLLSVLLGILLASTLRAGGDDEVRFERMQTVLPHVYLENLSDKLSKQVIFYYGNDSLDPYMQISTDYEVRSLIRSCKPELRTNWFVALNSHYLASSSFLYCKEGELKRGTWPASLRLNKVHEHIVDRFASREALSESLVDFSDAMGREFESPLVTFGLEDPELRDSFGTHPFANFDFVRLIWSYASYRFFPEDQGYALHSFFKSHGSEDLFLAGQTPAQLVRKTRQQRDLWDSITRKRRQAGLPTMDMPNIPFGQAGLTEEIDDELLTAYGLGRACTGECEQNLDQNIRQTISANQLNTRTGRLAIQYGALNTRTGRLDLSDDHFASSGLGEDSEEVGGTQVAAFKMFLSFSDIVDLFGLDFQIGFTAMESCNSGQDTYSSGDDGLLGNGMNRTMGWFAPAGGIWFRNFDFDTIIERMQSGGWNSAETVKFMSAWAAQIPNYVAVDEPQLTVVNECKVPLSFAIGAKVHRQLQPGQPAEYSGVSTHGWWNLKPGESVRPAVIKPEWIRIHRTETPGVLAPYRDYMPQTSLCSTMALHEFFLPIPEDSTYAAQCEELNGAVWDGFEQLYTTDTEIVIKNCQTQVRVCNNTTSLSYRKIAAAIGYYDYKEKKYMAKGWFTINQGRGERGCVVLPGGYDAPYLYIQGINSDGNIVQWRDEAATEDAEFCINKHDVFTMGIHDCAGDDDPSTEPKRFYKVPEINLNNEYTFSAGG